MPNISNFFKESYFSPSDEKAAVQTTVSKSGSNIFVLSSYPQAQVCENI
jgi:hypothetical protein